MLKLASFRLDTNREHALVLGAFFLWFMLYPFGEVMHIAAVPLLVCSIAMLIKRSGQYDAVVRHYLLVAALLIVPLVLTLTTALEPARHRDSIILWICYFLVGLYLVNLQVDKPFAEKIVYCIGGIALFLAFDGLVQFAVGFNLVGFPLEGGRVTGMFHPRLRLGNDLAHMSPFVFEAIRLYARHGRLKSLAWLLTIPLALAIFLSGNRSGWVVFFFVALGYGGFLIYTRQFPTKVFLILTALFVVLFAGLLQVSPELKQRVDRTLQVFSFDPEDINYASTKRISVFKSAISVIEEYPLLGVGRRGMDTALERQGVDANDIVTQGIGHAHLFLLDVPLHTGVIGTVPYAVLVVLLTLLVLKAVRQKNALLFTFSFAALLAINPLNTHYSVYDVRHSSLFWLLIGLAYMASRLKKTQDM